MTCRILFIDVIKIVAMVCVVGLHTTAGVPVLYATCSIAIPLFFMSTGYLMWDRKIGLRYILKKALLIARYVIIAYFFYWIIIGISKDSWNIEDLIIGLSVTGGHPFWQFWFFGSLLIVYALFPLFQRFKRYVIPIILTLFVLMQGVFFLIYSVFTTYH